MNPVWSVSEKINVIFVSRYVFVCLCMSLFMYVCVCMSLYMYVCVLCVCIVYIYISRMWLLLHRTLTRNGENHPRQTPFWFRVKNMYIIMNIGKTRGYLWMWYALIYRFLDSDISYRAYTQVQLYCERCSWSWMAQSLAWNGGVGGYHYNNVQRFALIVE